MRYVVLDPLSIALARTPVLPPPDGTPTPTLADLIPTVSDPGDSTGVNVVFGTLDATTQVAPVEVRGFWLAEGGSPFATGEEWIASGLPNTHANVEVPAEGLSVLLPTPDAAADGRYAAYVVLGFNA